MKKHIVANNNMCKTIHNNSRVAFIIFKGDGVLFVIVKSQ
jgi:hypothetical protein